MKKCIFSFVMTFIIALGIILVLPMTAEARTVASGTCGSNLTWERDDGGTLTISGTGDMWGSFKSNGEAADISSVKTVIINNGVTSIGTRAFNDCIRLTSVTIPDSVTSIGGYAFSGCTKLTNITIPGSVTSIGGSAFSDCTNLTSAAIPDSVTSIEDYTFSGCTNLTSVSIPDSVTSIGKYAFRDCANLTSVAIPDKVTGIKDYTFSGCTNLTSVTIPDSVTSIGARAFSGTGLVNITIPEGVISIGESAFSDCTSLTLVTIPYSVTSIGYSAFSDCTKLTSVIIPNSVTQIGGRAFYKCTSLTGITIPDSIKKIEANTFSECTNLTSVIIPDSVTSIGVCAFSDCTNLATITIPDSVTSIQNDYYGLPFYQDTTLLVKNQSYAHKYALQNKFYFKVLDSPITVTFDSNGGSAVPAEEDVTGNTAISAPENPVREGYIFLGWCDESNERIWDFSDYKITESVTFYAEWAECTAGSGISMGRIVDHGTCGDNLTWQLDDTGTLVVSGTGDMNGTNRSHGAGCPWGYQKWASIYSAKTVVFTNGITSVGSYVFNDNGSLTSVTIPESVTGIGEGAFEGCTNLTSVTIPDSVTDIGDKALDRSTTLLVKNQSYAHKYALQDELYFKVLDSPITVTFDSKGGSAVPAKEDVTGNAAISAPENPVREGYIFLGWCDESNERIRDFSDYKITESVTFYAEWADFTAGSGISMGNIVDQGTCGDNLTWQLDDTGTLMVFGTGDMTDISSNDIYWGWDEHQWGYGKRDSVRSAKTVIFANGVTSIGSNAFRDWTNLTGVTIPGSVASIGENAFYHCTNLTSVTIPDGVTSIGNEAFSGTGLTGVTIPGSVTSIGSRAFSYCTGLTGVTIPGSVTSIEAYTFHGCANLTDVTIPGSVTSIESGAFSGTNLTNITIPDSVTSIGTQAFSGTNLTGITIPDNVTDIGDEAFDDSTILLVKNQSNAYKTVLGTNFRFKFLGSPITVTFNSSGGSAVPARVDVIGNTTISAPKDPVRKGYLFEGWFDKANKKVSFSDYKIKESVTFYAKWEKITAKISSEPVYKGKTSIFYAKTNGPVRSIKWSISNKKVVKITKGAKKRTVFIKGIKKGKKAKIKADITFKDGTKKRLTKTISVKAKPKPVKRPSYPKGIRKFNKVVGAYDRGREGSDYVYWVPSLIDSRVISYLQYLQSRGYHQMNYYYNDMDPVFIYSKGASKVRISVIYGNWAEYNGYVYLSWSKTKNKK